MNAAPFHPTYIASALDNGQTAVLDRGECVFQSEDTALCERYIHLFSQLPEGCSTLMEEVRLWAHNEEHLRLSPACLLDLFDVLSPAPERPMPPMNPLALVASLYPQEYDTACYLARQTAVRFDTDLSDEQINALVAAMVRHQLDAVDCGPELGSITALLVDMRVIIQEDLSLVLDPENPNTRRFLVHLRYLAKRVLVDEPLAHEVDPEWYAEFTVQYPNAYHCTLKIADLLDEKYQHPIGVDERMYLLIHLAQLLRGLHKN